MDVIKYQYTIKMKRGALAAMVLIVVVLIAIGVYFGTQEKDKKDGSGGDGSGGDSVKYDGPLKDIEVGTPIQCKTNDPLKANNSAVYRVMDKKGKIRHYPNPDIASSWDPDWGSTFMKIEDCTDTTNGDPLHFAVGTPVQCKTNDPLKANNSAVYRVMDEKGTLRHYPNPDIASSWDPDWGSTYKKIEDCSGIPHGSALAKKS
jgi:hypothetical protein